MAAPLTETMLGYNSAGSLAGFCALGGWTNPTGGGSYNATDGPYGQGSIHLGGFSDWRAQHSIAARTGRTIFQWHVKHNTANVADATILELHNNSGANMCLRLVLTPSGALKIYDATGTLVETTADLFAHSTWTLLGLEADIGNTGIVKVWIAQNHRNSEPLVSLTAIDMADGTAGGCDSITLYGGGAGCLEHHALTGFVGDTAGPAPFDRYQGVRHWRPQAIAGAGVADDWTPSAGANHECVDDSPTAESDSDATHNESPAAPGVDCHALADSSAELHGVLYALVQVTAKKTGVGTPGDVALRMRSSGGTNSDGSALALTTAYAHYQHGLATAPGGAPLTKTAVDGLQIGYTSAGDAAPKARVSQAFLAVFAYPDDYFEPLDSCDGTCALQSMLA